MLTRLPDQGFDVTEVAVPWWPLTRAQHGNHSSARWPGDAYLFARRRITTLG